MKVLMNRTDKPFTLDSMSCSSSYTGSGAYPLESDSIDILASSVDS